MKNISFWWIRTIGSFWLFYVLAMFLKALMRPWDFFVRNIFNEFNSHENGCSFLFSLRANKKIPILSKWKWIKWWVQRNLSTKIPTKCVQQCFRSIFVTKEFFLPRRCSKERFLNRDPYSLCVSFPCERASIEAYFRIQWLIFNAY